MYSDRINRYHPGWRSPPDVRGSDESTGRNSVEEISLHIDVITLVIEQFFFIYYNIKPLAKKIYNEVHAQRSLAFIKRRRALLV